MTIYKTQIGDKKSEKEPEVLKEPLTGVKDEVDCEDAAGAVPKLVRVTYFPRRHHTWMNLCLILTALLVLGTGIIAAIFLYRHFSNKVVRGRCGVTYYDDFYHKEPEAQILRDAPVDYVEPPPPSTKLNYFEEEMEVSEVDLYERLTIPNFDEVEETVVWHDFFRNLTAIVDPNHVTCYIMSLNRSRIAPPRDLIDLIDKLKTRYYVPKVSVLREQYRVVLPPMEDLHVLGDIIMRECLHYYTFRLERFVSGVYKRSTDEVLKQMALEVHVAFFSWMKREDNSRLFKFDILREKIDQLPPFNPEA